MFLHYALRALERLDVSSSGLTEVVSVRRLFEVDMRQKGWQMELLCSV